MYNQHAVGRPAGPGARAYAITPYGPSGSHNAPEA